jgi:hypothetical protein
MTLDTKVSNSDSISLARGYSLAQVAGYLAARNKEKLHDFLKERYEERYFEPINFLIEGSRCAVADPKGTPTSLRNYGFAVMSLCCLLVETLQCYRDGMRTTSPIEWKKKKSLINGINSTAPSDYKIRDDEIQTLASGSKRFETFFGTYKSFFPGLRDIKFYENIRNGLLHQAQTKSGWKIVAYGDLCNPLEGEKTINRDKFAKALRSAFNSYLGELRRGDDDLWEMARRKIWWLTELSK